MERTVVLEGLVNCRDLGGLRRTDGTVTPSGVFFRSENLDRITATGWDQLHALGVRTIVDLRQPRERAKDVQVRPAWLHTIAVDLDGLDHTEFWKDYWENGLVTTALYFIPHVVQLPERAGQALVALATAPAGGVLFHCMAGRDRTGLIAMLLLAAAQVEPEEIVADYMETVRLGHVRAAATGQRNAEPDSEVLCSTYGTTTEGAFRDALRQLNLDQFWTAAHIDPQVRMSIQTWRRAICG